MRASFRWGITALAIAATLSACGSLDDIARQVAQKGGQSGAAADDVANLLRGLGSTEDDAVRLGQGILGSSAGRSTAEGRVGAWVDDALVSLTPEEQATVRGVALSATCDALDSVAQGQFPDLGTMVFSGLGSLSPAVDQQLLRTQLDDMLNDLRPGGEAAFAARIEIVSACIIADL